MHPYVVAQLATQRQDRLLAEAPLHQHRAAARARHGAARQAVLARLRTSVSARSRRWAGSPGRGLTRTVDPPAPLAGIAAAQDAIAHLVVEAYEAGGPRWQEVAARLSAVLGDDLPCEAPPVVLARALGRAQRRERALAERAVAEDDLAGVVGLAGRLEQVLAGLASSPRPRPDRMTAPRPGRSPALTGAPGACPPAATLA